MNGQDIKYISLFEAAKLTSYSQEYISLLCRQKKLKGTKIGRNWVTTKEWVEGYINNTKGKGQNIIPVKIKSAEDTELNSEASLTKNTPVGDSAPPAIGKLILAAVICSLFISGFIFSQLGFQNRIIKTNPSQVVKGASAHIAEGIISISNSLDMIKNGSAKFGKERIASVDHSLNDIKFSFSDSASRLGDDAEFIAGKSFDLAGDAKVGVDEIFVNMPIVLGEKIAGAAYNIPIKTGQGISDAGYAISFEAGKLLGKTFYEAPMYVGNSIEDKFLKMTFALSEEIIINNKTNKTEITDTTKQGRVAGVSNNESDNLENSETSVDYAIENNNVLPENLNQENNNIEERIITLSNFLDDIKNKSIAKAAQNIFQTSASFNFIKNETVNSIAFRINNFNNSLEVIKSETAEFAIGEIYELRFSLEAIKNKSEEKIKIALNGKPAAREEVPFAADNSPEEKEKSEKEKSVEDLEKNIISDVQKRFDQFQEELSINQNYGAAVVPYSDAQDKDKKIENLKESFSDGVSIEEDEDGKTGTITADIPGEDQKYLYLMVPMKE